MSQGANQSTLTGLALAVLLHSRTLVLERLHDAVLVGGAQGLVGERADRLALDCIAAG